MRITRTLRRIGTAVAVATLAVSGLTLGAASTSAASGTVHDHRGRPRLRSGHPGAHMSTAETGTMGQVVRPIR